MWLQCGSVTRADGRKSRVHTPRNPPSPPVGALKWAPSVVGSGVGGGAVCARPGVRRGAERPQESGCGARAARSRPQPAPCCPGDLPWVAMVGLWAGVRGGSGVAGGRAPPSARGEIEGWPATPAATSPLARLPPDQARGARPAPMRCCGSSIGGREGGWGREARAAHHSTCLPAAAAGASPLPTEHMDRALGHTGCTADANQGGQ